MRQSISFRLSEETLTLAQSIAGKFGLTRAGAIEYSVRRIGEIEGLTAKPTDPPPASKPARKARKAAGK